MTDAVDIYRDLRRDIENAIKPQGMSVHDGKVRARVDLIARALAEIDALRAETERLRSQALDYLALDGQVQELQAENARLRAALEAFPTDDLRLSAVQRWMNTTRAKALKHE